LSVKLSLRGSFFLFLPFSSYRVTVVDDVKVQRASFSS
jgi:hypothetical protein